MFNNHADGLHAHRNHQHPVAALADTAPHCPLCSNHCPLTEPDCRRGEAYSRSQERNK